MSQETDKRRGCFSVKEFRFESESFSGPDGARRVAEKFVNEATWQEVRGFSIDHEIDHALSDSPVREGRAQGRFVLSGLSVELPFGRRWVVAVPEYEPIGERSSEEWKKILGSPPIPSPMDIINILKLRLRREEATKL